VAEPVGHLDPLIYRSDPPPAVELMYKFFPEGAVIAPGVEPYVTTKLVDCFNVISPSDVTDSPALPIVKEDILVPFALIVTAIKSPVQV
jgi:hypothetical protein